MVFRAENDGEVRKCLSALLLEMPILAEYGRGRPRPFPNFGALPKMAQNDP